MNSQPTARVSFPRGARWMPTRATPQPGCCSWLTMPKPIGKKLRYSIFRLLGILVARTLYRVKTFGLENLPKTGFLLVPNHMTYVDAVLLQLACPRPIRFIVHESIYRIGWLTPIFKLVEAIPISNVRAKEALREAADRIRR